MQCLEDRDCQGASGRADTGKGSHAICEAVNCCQYASNYAMWWDMWEVLRPFYTPDAAGEWSYEDLSGFYR
jgi:hypothetical protein